jgi:hypothetical protein
MNSEITVLTKANGPLTKRISLADGKVVSDGSACVMSAGSAQRARLTDVHALASLLGTLTSAQAIALGALRPDLADQVKVVTKRKLNGQAQTIARTGADIRYQKDRPAFSLLDYDQKGMPVDVAAALERHGGYWSALCAVLPALTNVARVTRYSTSAGLYCADTGTELPGSGGVHVFVPVRDGTDIERFLKVLHDRSWLAGLGWFMVGAGGQLLDRSIVDRMVGAPERLVFEGAPVLHPPLKQDTEKRRPIAVEGDTLDTLAACPPLTVAEKARLTELKTKQAHRLAPERAKSRVAFIKHQATRLAKRTGISAQAAERTIARQCDGVLLPDVELPFDDEELAHCSVADVLADPEKFEGATLADPLEGIDYGRCKARIMRRADGTPWINSFAHGRTVYELKLNTAALRTALARVADDAAARTFVELAMTADLDESELEELRNYTAKRSGINKRTISAMLKAAQEKKTEKRLEELRQLALAQRQDPRPMIAGPALDEAWLPQMDTLNDVIGGSSAARPRLRNVDGTMTRAGKLGIPGTHIFNSTNTEEGESTKLPPPEQWVLIPMNEMEVAEMIEQHIDFIDKNGRSVHLPMQFVRHYVTRHDGALPTVVATTTLPIVLADGVLLAPDGLDRLRGILFEIQNELRAILPDQNDCTADGVRAAMQFLTDKWLCDVLADHAGKCILIAAALTIIERTLLPDRPAFFVTAGRRGSGKSTTVTMLIKAITGFAPAAAAWSTNEEERRKALLSHFIYGASYILWDNIARGAQISCPHIEKACTAAFYSDRRLGVSEMVTAAASAIHFFTGNNIGPRGDLASRSLHIRLEVDRPDPENRKFKHPDPIGWTESHRAEILRALYTILLGNPALDQPRNAQAKTRFKMWWRLVGSAVEHASKLISPHQNLDFQSLFLTQEEEDEDTASLAEALAIMAKQWPAKPTFTAADVAEAVNAGSQTGLLLRDFLFPAMPPGALATPKSVGRRLKCHVGEPVQKGAKVLTLSVEKTGDKALNYFIKSTQKRD